MDFALGQNVETGNAAIDTQHKQLIAMLNALHGAYQSGKGRQEVERTMEFLVAYTIKHFADEEKLQEKYDYPEYFAHKHLHTEFRELVQELAAKMSRDGPTDDFIREIYITISEWLFNHIKNEDFKMAEYIQSKTPTA